ncbi:MAG: tRNA (adenosine(37)-N6)-threonylcarbamoyltransferase complex dimerization subunit type 1 TsaB [Acidobacteriota bacterium]|nr:MAG: tRNA (adenosine(37)-N6)-threonylcarbamoyltransferase complex dimerization subunit type 1 TsaB [Acidobacteriota bacterium]
MQTRGNQRDTARTPEGRRRRAVLLVEGGLWPAGAALVAGQGIIACEQLDSPRRPRQDLFTAVRQVLARSVVAPEELSAVVVGTGPGSFTGLRIAMSVIRGLERGLKNDSEQPLAVFGADSPRLLAEAAGAARPVLTALPWGRLRVLLATAGQKGPQLFEPGLIPRSSLIACQRLVGRCVVVPSELASERWPRGVELLETKRPILEAMAAAYLAGELAELALLEPTYLVAPDAVAPARAPSLPAGCRLVRLSGADCRELALIERRSYPRPWSIEKLAEELEPPESLDGPVERSERVAFGIRAAGGRLLGYALSRADGPVMSVLNLAIDPEHRRRGLARSLTRRLVAEARTRGLGRVNLEVRAGNEAALALYASEGFVRVGRRPGYYPGGEDAVLMSLLVHR